MEDLDAHPGKWITHDNSYIIIYHISYLFISPHSSMNSYQATLGASGPDSSLNKISELELSKRRLTIDHQDKSQILYMNKPNDITKSNTQSPFPHMSTLLSTIMHPSIPHTHTFNLHPRVPFHLASGKTHISDVWHIPTDMWVIHGFQTTSDLWQSYPHFCWLTFWILQVSIFVADMAIPYHLPSGNQTWQWKIMKKHTCTLW